MDPFMNDRLDMLCPGPTGLARILAAIEPAIEPAIELLAVHAARKDPSIEITT